MRREVEALAKTEVDDAKIPLLAQRAEVVAAAVTPKFSSQVKGLPPALVASVPQESLPLVSALTSQEAALRPETIIPVEDAVPRSVEVPVLSTRKRVVVADAVDDPMAKRVVLVSPLLAWRESLPHGVEEPTPRNPAEVTVVVPVEPKYAALKTAKGEVVAAVTAPATVGKVKSEPPEPVASVPQESTPLVLAFTSQLAALRRDTVRLLVDAVPK